VLGVSPKADDQNDQDGASITALVAVAMADPSASPVPSIARARVEVRAAPADLASPPAGAVDPADVTRQPVRIERLSELVSALISRLLARLPSRSVLVAIGGGALFMLLGVAVALMHG
jgi:hypothetical protein